MQTYPTNSGQGPAGAESLARESLGQNLMSPKCAASLMAEIVAGTLHPQARSYMLGLLGHYRWNSYSPFGYGLPPGTRVWTKSGNAYDTLEEIAYVKLPNGRTFVLAAYSNALELSQPWPTSNLGRFAELLLEYTGLTTSPPSPQQLVFDVSSPNFRYIGNGWQTGTDLRDTYGKAYFFNADAGPGTKQALWNYTVDATGVYEVSIWSPQSSSHVSSAGGFVTHAYGTDTFSINQQILGGRWRKLGDWTLQAGRVYTIAINAPASGSGGKRVVANAVKVHAWPSCKGVPGSPCDF